jgi:hypothetical protein
MRVVMLTGVIVKLVGVVVKRTGEVVMQIGKVVTLVVEQAAVKAQKTVKGMEEYQFEQD